MFSILRWFFWVIVLLLGVYFAIVLFKYITSGATADTLSNTLSTSSVDSAISKSGVKNIFPNLNLSFEGFKNFFTPHFVSPMTVVPSAEWYASMGAFQSGVGVYSSNSLDEDFQKYVNSLGYPNNVNGNLNNNQNSNYTNTSSSTNTKSGYNYYFNKLVPQQLFPSSWMYQTTTQ